MPVVKGVISNPDTQVITLGASPLGPITQAEDPTNVVRLYKDPLCEGTQVAQGTVATLSEGIQVTVPPNSVTTFYATQEDAGGPSGCSNGLRYRQVSTPPSVPVFTSIDPASPANNNFPRLIGSADPEATVSIYAGAGCGGAAVASGSGEQFGGEGILVGVADNTETIFSARVTLAGFFTECSGPVEYREITPPAPAGPEPGGSNGGGGVEAPVATPPAPRLRTVPGGSANDNTPLVTGSAPAAAVVKIFSTADCQGPLAAKGSADDFAAGLPVRVMDNATVVLSALSSAGDKVSKCSDPVVYVEDSLAPRTRITMGPAAKTAKRKAVIRFTDTTGTSPGTVFLCKVDKKKWSQCSSPLKLKKLKPKRHVIRVKAADPAGNVEIKGAKRAFKVIRRS